MKRALLILSTVLLPLGTATAQEGDLRVTRSSVPGVIFGSSMANGADAEHMRKSGYTEEEVFLSGEANIYRYGADGRPEVDLANVPYTTRVLIIRPADPKRFSGRAIIEPYHPGAAAISWAGMREFTLRNGDIYVGVFVGGAGNRVQPPAGLGGAGAGPAAAASARMDGLAALRNSNPARYAAIVWPDDNGVQWDVFGQAARLLRSTAANNPLKAFPIRRMYATGWSATGSFLRTYTNEGFHERYRRADGMPTIDGYVWGISQGSFIAGYNQLAAKVPLPAPDDPRRRPRPIDAPVIEIMSENEAITKIGPEIQDSDARVGRHRYYELPGTTHTDAMGGAAAPNFMIKCKIPATDVPFLEMTWAAFENVHQWVQKGLAPPRQGAPMKVVPGPAGSAYKIVAEKDALGNAKGGVRVAEVEVPLARYGVSGDPACASPMPAALIEMRRNALDKATVARLYPGGAAEYLRRYEAALDRQIAARWLLARDKPQLMTRARRTAAEAFR